MCVYHIEGNIYFIRKYHWSLEEQKVFGAQDAELDSRLRLYNVEPFLPVFGAMVF